MNQPRRRKHTDVPLSIDGNIKYVKGVTRYTTCADVIKMVMKKADTCRDENQSEAFGIYESSRGIERLLPAKCRILKVIRSWGADDDYKLIFRHVQTTFAAPKISDAKRRKLINRQRAPHASILSDMNTQNNCDANNGCNFVKEMYVADSKNLNDRFPQSSTKGFCATVTSEKMNNLPSSKSPDMNSDVTGHSNNFGLVLGKNVTFKYNANEVKLAVKKTLKTRKNNTEKTTKTINHHCQKRKKENIAHIKRHEKLANHVVSKVSRMDQKDGKEALLQKYFADYITYRSPPSSFLDSRLRERGDGAETSLGAPSCATVESNALSVTSTQGEHLSNSRDVSNDSGHEDDSFGLDTAFILDQSDNDLEPSFEYKVPNVSPCEEYDQINPLIKTRPRCPGNGLVDYSFSDDDSTTTDDEMGIDVHSGSGSSEDISNVSDIVKSVFSVNKDDTDEDDEMESFMRTKIFDGTSDEGLSSFNEDDAKEIMV